MDKVSSPPARAGGPGCAAPWDAGVWGRSPHGAGVRGAQRCGGSRAQRPPGIIYFLFFTVRLLTPLLWLTKEMARPHMCSLRTPEIGFVLDLLEFGFLLVYLILICLIIVEPPQGKYTRLFKGSTRGPY